jgi:hypothetical protein
MAPDLQFFSQASVCVTYGQSGMVTGFFSQYFVCPLSVLFQQCSILILSPTAVAISQQLTAPLKHTKITLTFFDLSV